jgi:hypothetical protein
VALNFHLETSLRLLRVLESTHLNKLTKIPNSLRLQTTKRGRDTDSQTEKRGGGDGGVRKAGNRDGKLLRVVGNNQLIKHSLQRNPIL